MYLSCNKDSKPDYVLEVDGDSNVKLTLKSDDKSISSEFNIRVI